MTDVLPTGERRQLAPPIDETGTMGWMRKNLFSSWGNGITTVVLIVAVAWLLSWFLNWALFTATFTAPNGQACRGHGACWALIHEKYRYIFFGSFPYQQHWRPLLAVIAMLAMLLSSADRRMWNTRLIVDLDDRLVRHLPADVRRALLPDQPVPRAGAGRRRHRPVGPQPSRPAGRSATPSAP